MSILPSQPSFQSLFLLADNQGKKDFLSAFENAFLRKETQADATWEEVKAMACKAYELRMIQEYDIGKSEEENRDSMSKDVWTIRDSITCILCRCIKYVDLKTTLKTLETIAKSFSTIPKLGILKQINTLRTLLSEHSELDHDPVGYVIVLLNFISALHGSVQERYHAHRLLYQSACSRFSNGDMLSKSKAERDMHHNVLAKTAEMHRCLLVLDQSREILHHTMQTSIYPLLQAEAKENEGEEKKKKEEEEEEDTMRPMTPPVTPPLSLKRFKAPPLPERQRKKPAQEGSAS